jgi:hypothetical protein
LILVKPPKEVVVNLVLGILVLVKQTKVPQILPVATTSFGGFTRIKITERLTKVEEDLKAVGRVCLLAGCLLGLALLAALKLLVAAPLKAVRWARTRSRSQQQ